MLSIWGIFLVCLLLCEKTIHPHIGTNLTFSAHTEQRCLFVMINTWEIIFCEVYFCFGSKSLSGSSSMEMELNGYQHNLEIGSEINFWYKILYETLKTASFCIKPEETGKWSPLGHILVTWGQILNLVRRQSLTFLLE